MVASDLSVEALAAQIAHAIASQLAAGGQDDVSKAHLRRSTLKLEGFLTSEGTETSRIHLGTFDLSHLQPSATSAGDYPLYTGVDQHQLAADASQTQSPPRLLRPRRPNTGSSSSVSSDSEDTRRRKATGGLRLATSGLGAGSLLEQDESHINSSRQIESNVRSFPKRKKRKNLDEPPALRATSCEKLIEGIWEQIYGSTSFDLEDITKQWHETTVGGRSRLLTASTDTTSILQQSNLSSDGYSEISIYCRRITQASRCSRALEVLVQARWIECFEARVDTLLRETVSTSLTKAKMTALKEACQAFAWSEKEMRNKMAVWRGYKELKDAGGWVVLVFAGMGIYRFCKYRACFDESSMSELRCLGQRLEVAADTLHPRWRQLLSIVGESMERRFDGHPHDWVISEGSLPVPLRSTYLQWDEHFSFEHLESSVIDGDTWELSDPRKAVNTQDSENCLCSICNELQSNDIKTNACQCYPNLYGGRLGPSPTQVFHTPGGKNNGLLACLGFERGQAIGEFVGLITKNLENVDVMQGKTIRGRYQIWQGRQGNFTKFVNHSCMPNSQFERFNWLNTQRIVLVSKGIQAGEEITVDYSDEYWRNLDKTCLCGSSTCRYRRNNAEGSPVNN